MATSQSSSADCRSVSPLSPGSESSVSPIPASASINTVAIHSTGLSHGTPFIPSSVSVGSGTLASLVAQPVKPEQPWLTTNGPPSGSTGSSSVFSESSLSPTSSVSSSNSNNNNTDAPNPSNLSVVQSQVMAKQFMQNASKPKGLSPSSPTITDRGQ